MNTNSELKIVVVAGNLLARMGLATLLNQTDSLAVVGQIGMTDVSGAVMDVYRPDALVWIVDDDLPTASLLADISAPVLFLLMDTAQARNLFATVRAHISENTSMGILSQNPLSSTRLASAIHGLYAGLVVIDPALTDMLMTADDPDTRITPADGLTPREMQVLQRMAEGLPNKQIARDLGISPNTVKFHVNAILTKLDAQSRTEAVIRATQLGWVLL